MADRGYLERLTKQLADDGKLIEAGWVALRLAAMPPDAPPVQLTEMRMAFMAGAQHLFSSIISMLEPGSDETPTDLRRMDLIHKELEAFRKELELRVGPSKGSA
jgi:hypothetical protein